MQTKKMRAEFGGLGIQPQNRPGAPSCGRQGLVVIPKISTDETIFPKLALGLFLYGTGRANTKLLGREKALSALGNDGSKNTVTAGSVVRQCSPAAAHAASIEMTIEKPPMTVSNT